jgi:hypothetical protein
MAELPNASVTIDDEAGAFGGGTGYIVVAGCAANNADAVPRVFASTRSLLENHDYTPAVSYCASHFQETGLPVIFCGLPIATPGVVGSEDDTGVTGTSVITAVAGASGALEQLDGRVEVVTGGTIGTSQIVLDLSLNGGRTSTTVRLGTASSYAIPYVGVTLNFAAGTLVAGDVFTFRTTAPMWDSAGLALAKANLAAQLKLSRTWLVVGDLPSSTFAGYVTTQVNAYETADDRFVFARCSVKDRLPLAKKSKVGGETLTFNTTGDTITRSAGSWLDDGFAVGDTVTIDGTLSNDGSFPITALSATVLTTSVNLVNETIDSEDVDVVKALTKAAWMSALDSSFASVDGQKRISLSAGRGWKQDPITGVLFRRPASWFASLREYGHDLHIPTFRKADGPLDGVSLEDEDGNIVDEFDERVDGGGLAARFTCLRTYSNGPRGTFVALDLTRATEGSLLSRTQNMAVANLACTVCQAETENAIGQVLELTDDGTATPAARQKIESRVNSALQRALLQAGSEGARASYAKWSASAADVLNVPGAEMTGVLELRLNGTLERITTRVLVQTNG